MSDIDFSKDKAPSFINSVYPYTKENDLTFHLEHFEGPLELLLALISKNKVNIYDIPISLILDQYMEYIHDMEESNMEIQSSFIVMAAQLMLIKSRMLLPAREKDEDPRKELVDLLLEYQKASVTAQVLREREELYSGCFEKPAENIEDEPEYTLEHEISLLIEAFTRIYARKTEEQEILKEKTDPLGKLLSASKQVSVNEKILHILRKLKGERACSLTSLFHKTRTRNELVATFLAILELIRGKTISIKSVADDYSECEFFLSS